MAIELVPLCEVTATLAPLDLPGTPAGHRVVLQVLDGRLEGERLNATAVSAGADWILIGPDGTGMLDVRFSAETDDGALIYVQYNGRADVRQGPGTAPIYVAPRFETGDERYAWLNRIQAVGKGALDGNTVTYDWYEIR
jgi:Protein of unknown function (DUF3237)